ncbi:MAG: precorrin-6y C5,15-methyltransferase (decarboxylating) subunit CbiE [Deltaproteobacteria bacterium]|nr:precorrin-6y C5,15-methyltransferase (decarboxylating) subunit CbiE [Deltaproteobacteria bacterium]
MTNPVSIIGMGLSPRDLTAKHIELIQSADILIGGARHLAYFKNYPAAKKEITKDIKGLIEYLKDRIKDHSSQSIVILASGDPLFFGIGSVLTNALGPDNVTVYPNITSVAAAFSLIKEPWSDAHIVSLHGRDRKKEFLEMLLKTDKIAVFTDPGRNPAWLADFMLKNGFADFDMCVFEQLGSSSEHFEWYELPTAAVQKEFSEPNLVVLKRKKSAHESNETKQTKNDQSVELYPGAPDSWFDHQKGLITKAEVRAVTLSKLRLASNHILWDLGAGSGSVSMESSLFVKTGKIFAVEKELDRIRQIQNNKDRFGVKNLEIINAVLPEALENLPRPDRIFIGGGGSDLENIIISAAQYLNDMGIMVINTVLIANIDTALGTLERIGFKTEIVQVQINRGRNMPWGKRLEAQNPVWIISGTKEKKACE